MEFTELVEKRRSCRNYLNGDIKKEDLEEIIRVALQAPSWENREVGRYYVAISEEAKKLIYDGFPGFNKEATKNAAYIISCFKKGEAGCDKINHYVDRQGDEWGAYDLGLQNSYLMLKATELGYDTLVCGLRDELAIREYFNIPEDEEIMPVIAIGKKAKELHNVKRKDVKDVLKVK